MNQNMDPNQMNQQGMQQGMQQGQNMTKEELKNTQVLNLNDVKQTAKQESKASFPKKIAIMLFVVGVLAIAGGFSYNSIASMMGMNPANSGNKGGNSSSESTSKEATAEEQTTAGTTTCSAEFKAQSNGTDKTVTYELTFDANDQLQNYTKTLDLLPTTGNSTGPVTVNTFKQGYTTISGYQIPGYTLTVKPTSPDGTTTGIQTIVTIDLVNLDKEKYSSSNMMNDELAMIEFELNAPKDTVVQTLTDKSYTCQ